MCSLHIYPARSLHGAVPTGAQLFGRGVACRGGLANAAAPHSTRTAAASAHPHTARARSMPSSLPFLPPSACRADPSVSVRRVRAPWHSTAARTGVADARARARWGQGNRAWRGAAVVLARAACAIDKSVALCMPTYARSGISRSPVLSARLASAYLPLAT